MQGTSLHAKQVEVHKTSEELGASHVHLLMRNGSPASHLGSIFGHARALMTTIDSKYHVEITQKPEKERTCRETLLF